MCGRGVVEDTRLAGHRVKLHALLAGPLDLHAVDLVGRGAVAFQTLDLGIGEPDQLVEVLAGSREEIDLEGARQQMGGVEAPACIAIWWS